MLVLRVLRGPSGGICDRRVARPWLIGMFVMEVRGIHGLLVGLKARFIEEGNIAGSYTCLFEVKELDHVYNLDATFMV
jgi:hypothetical protein